MTALAAIDPATAEAATVIRPQPGPQSAFLETAADIAIYGGAAGGGKSWALLLDPLRHVDLADFGGVIFRRNTVQIRNEGGLWDESVKLYPLVGARPRENVLEWRFPSGAAISFGHLEHDKTVFDWQGSQIPYIGFDELTHFSARQFWYMLSRNRSMSGVRPYVRATTNPDADSWVAKLIEWWIDQATGLPIAERAGVLRWFVRIGDEIVWADRPEDLARCLDAAGKPIPPKSLTFIPAKLTDNAALMAADPSYMANLMALSLVDRERLLGGNWKVRPTAGMFFRRDWFEIVDAAPAYGRRARAWDLASVDEAVAQAEGTDPDWTVGLAGKRAPDGVFYLTGNVRLRGSPLAVERAIKNTASQDGRACTIRLPQDPAQAGKSQAAAFIRLLAGYDVKAVPVSRTDGSKQTRAKPASAQAEAGNIKIVRTGDPARDAWIEPFLAELEAFPLGGHDDQVDALADLIDELAIGGGLPEVETTGERRDAADIEAMQAREDALGDPLGRRRTDRGSLW